MNGIVTERRQFIFNLPTLLDPKNEDRDAFDEDAAGTMKPDEDAVHSRKRATRTIMIALTQFTFKQK